MTTLYKPVLIETVEQAEALPVGTVAIEPDTEADRFSLMRVNYDGLECWITDKKIYTIDFPAGWTALVPIEADTEYATDESVDRWSFDGIYDSPENVRRDRWAGPLQARYVTPFEAA